MALDLTGESNQEERRNEVLLTFLEALEAGQEPDRDAFLAAHPDLRQDLESFLTAHDTMARLVVPLRPSGGNAPIARSSPPCDEPARAVIPSIGELGDFRLLREVGRGGMGVVYEAEQISLRRRVALKVLPFAAAIDPRRLQRFKTEALTAAHVQHERIVPVYAVGSERGVHYYAMQFIDGQSLAALIAELRRLHDPPGSPGAGCESTLSDGGAPAATYISLERASDRSRYFDRMASLGRQAALALEHAHQSGIVHRDVKPGNLLLDLRDQLWVTDFGLAQVTGDPGLTMTGELLGTLRYASPEQVLARRGIVDHRSDIYSLGATLYELLVLRPPFEGRDRPSLIQQIAVDDPPALRQWDPSLPSEVETIVLKALRKEPADRYATAQEMADDLERFINRRPILARRPTPAERLRTWSRRHPSVVGAGVLALILLSTASMVSTALVRREQAKTLAEQRNAESAYRRERQRAEEAEAQFRLARRSVDELIRVSEEELAHRPGMEGLRKRLLATALAYYQEFIEQRRSDAPAQVELRDTTRRVETILADLAVLRAAGELYLLAQPSAHDDLRLDPGQRVKVADLSERAGKRWLETLGDPVQQRTAAERVRLALELARANEAEVDAILTASQRVRLRQLALQSEGPAAFRQPEVVEALRLTIAQREQIRAIEEEALFSQIRDRQSNRATVASDKPAIDRIIAALTPNQAERWSKLAGPPIRGPLAAFPAPFRGQREPRRGPR